MSDYTKSTNFASKDNLASGNSLKIVKGTEIDTEFNNIATAIATKADLTSPTFTGTATSIEYVVSDALGQKTASTITPTVTPPPAPVATPEQKVVLPGDFDWMLENVLDIAFCFG